MKKLFALLLALVTGLSALNGMALAADNTVEIKLRPGRTVDVGDPAAFEAAYKAIYEPGSDINRIRLTDSMKVYTRGLRTPGGHDPWVSGYENQLCVRMPEGTCLDLAGCTLAVRSSQGQDDNGTGTPSGQMHFGTVIDTLGSGMLNLYCFATTDSLLHTLELARAHSDIVGIVSVSQATPGAEEHEFVIPAGVCLRLSGAPSHLPAKKLTFEPGATIEKVNAGSPGFEGCGEIVWQYTDEADLNRPGKEFATKTEKVSGAAPTREYKTYSITVEGGDKTVTVKGKPPVTVKEPLLIETASQAVTEAAVIRDPSGIELWEPKELTYEQMQDMIQNIALVYYYLAKDEAVIQYDGKVNCKVKRMERKGNDGPPELAAFDSTFYSVCSSYCQQVYTEGFAFKTLFGSQYLGTKALSDLDPDKNPGVIYQYSGPLAQNSKGETDLNKAVAESRKLVQAGDIVVYSDNGSGGHAMLFVGDIFGDGTDYILHCKGNSYDTATGQDLKEAPGQCIELMKADETVWGGPGVSWSLNRSADHVKLGWAILRPWLEPGLPKTPTGSGMSRLQFPRMIVTRELDRYKYDPAQSGEEIPVYLTITNHSTQTYEEVPVEEYIPAGTTLVEGSATKGVQQSGSTLKWAVKIPAGKSITLTYKVKLTGNLGDTVEFKAGKVAALQSRPTSLQIGGVPLTDAQHMALLDHAMAIRGTKDDYRDLDFFNKFYADALGVRPGLPKTTAELVEQLACVEGGGFHRAGSSELDKMIIPLHFTGQYAYPTGSNWGRVREYKYEYYQPGDIFVCLDGSNTLSVTDTKEVDLMMYLGDGKILLYNEDGPQVKAFAATMGYALRYNLLIGLRPTLGIADLNTRPAREMAFTDVSEADWFFPYVEEMFEEGIINGMTETAFAPKGSLTWGQALKLVALAVGEGEQPAGSHWASGYLSLAKNKGWLKTDVDLNANITRKEFCQVAAKAKNLTEMPKVNPFTDTVSKDVMALYHAGVINGMTETTFEPDTLLTRAQIAKIISLLMKA